MKKIAIFTAVLLTGCSLSPKSSEVTADSVLDDQIFMAAVNQLEVSQCFKISDPETKSECQMSVEDLLTTNVAIIEMDSSICAKAQIDRYKENCKTQVKAKIKLQEEDNNRLKSEQQAIDKNNPELCDSIKDISQKSMCRFNVLANQAIELKDPSVCEGIGLSAMILKCKNFIN